LEENNRTQLVRLSILLLPFIRQAIEKTGIIISGVWSSGIFSETRRISLDKSEENAI
jgi:hypothetical protein